MAKSLPLGLFTKLLVPKQRFSVLLEIIHERNGVEAEIGAGKFITAIVGTLNLATPNVIDARAPEGLRRFARVTTMADCPHIGGVIGARSGRHVRIAKQSLFDAELLVHVRGHQHNVHEALVNDFANDIEKFGKIAVPELVAGPEFRGESSWPFASSRQIGTWSRRAHAKGHVRILGVRQDKGARG